MPFWFCAPPFLALEFALRGLEILEHHCLLTLRLQKEMLKIFTASDGASDGMDRSTKNVVAFRARRTSKPAVIVELR